MENATDALKMAFAVMVFVMALTISIIMFSQLNSTSKMLIEASDSTKYYEYNIATEKNRTVGLETIIPTLYKYYKENYTVLFLDKDGYGLGLYSTNTNKELWGTGTDSYNGLIGKYYKNKSDNNLICAFDVDEETIRHEPWTGSLEDYKNNLDAFLSGGVFNYPSGQGEYNYNGFISKYSGKKFTEKIGEYTYNYNGSTNDGTTSSLLKNKKKRVIIYQLAN